MNKLMFTKVWYGGQILFCADFTDKNNVELDIKVLCAANSINVEKKATLDKKQSNTFYNALIDLDVELDRDYGCSYVTDIPQSNLFLLRGLNVITSHWESNAADDKAREIYGAMIGVCPELSKLI